ncbi:MAG: hypothetical protein EOM20_02710 [Spartobacteria bacterium]|nr:hypothetical protein [Spartobacteria bacterium]
MKTCIKLVLLLTTSLFAFNHTDAYYARYCGKNDYGEGGLGDKYRTEFFTQINGAYFKQVASGMDHTLFLTAGGEVYGTGDNRYGQLGLGAVDEVLYPTLITMPNNLKAKDIACGHHHSLVLAENGAVYAFGLNTKGQLGIGNNVNCLVPTLTRFAFITKIACGSYFSAALTHLGQVLVTGDNGYGQLSQNNTTDRNSWVSAYSEQVVDIACGASHLMMRFNGGSHAVAGRNDYGQLGLGDNVHRLDHDWLATTGMIQTACGDYHTLFLHASGRIYSTGINNYGQLGHGNTTDRNVPTLINDVSANNITKIAAGGNHSMFVRYDGTLMVFGHNNRGQLGLNHTTNRLYPERLYGISGVLDVSLGWRGSAIIMPALRSAPNDYDGDGISDLAVYYGVSSPYWYIRRSSQPSPPVELDLGWSTFIPVTGDYDGDGVADPAIYNPDTGNWFIMKSTLKGGVDVVNWGWDAAIAVPADYNGDGFTDIAVYWPAGGIWYIKQPGDIVIDIDWGWDNSQPVGGCF